VVTWPDAALSGTIALVSGAWALDRDLAPDPALADVVVRPPDLRHLDAAFQGVSRRSGQPACRRIGERFATACPTCGRTLAAEELVWEPPVRREPGPVRRASAAPPA